MEKVERLKEEILDKIELSGEVDDALVFDAIDRALAEFVDREYLSIEERLLLRKEVFNAIRRLDVLTDLIEDNEITEIMVNGPDLIFAEREGRLFLTDKRFSDEERLRDIMRRIASSVNRTINESHPIVDARLSEGYRVNIVLPPVSLTGPVITIRKFSRDVIGMERLVELGSLTKEAAMALSILVRGHYNIICSGGTGCGKTTLLNALSDYIDPDERVVTIEDSAELSMPHLQNIVSLEAREANFEGKNAITIRDLIKTSLRMRPDRLIVGEVRGKETIDMIQSLNTGHCGMSTAHSNSPRDLLFRLETMVLLDENIPLPAIRAQIASAVDIIVGISRMRDKSRKITEICEVDGLVDGEIKLRTLYKYEEANPEGAFCGDSEILKGSLVKKAALKHRDKLKSLGLDVEGAWL